MAMHATPRHGEKLRPGRRYITSVSLMQAVYCTFWLQTSSPPPFFANSLLMIRPLRPVSSVT
jgi:hypothetical protein